MSLNPTKNMPKSSPMIPKAAAVAAGEYQNGGLFPGNAGGRSDSLKASVDPQSYIIPADVVSAVGDGNTSNGAAVLDQYFGQDPQKDAGPILPPQDPNAPQIPRNSFAAGGMPPGLPAIPGAMPQPMPARGIPSAVGMPGQPAPMPPPHPLLPPIPGAAIPIKASSGEYQVRPDTVAKIGGGDMKHGHSVLDHFVTGVRKQYVNHLKKLPKPKK